MRHPATLQSFYFETYNPVREVGGGKTQLESAEIINRTIFLSLASYPSAKPVFLPSSPFAVKTPHWRCRSLTVRRLFFILPSGQHLHIFTEMDMGQVCRRGFFSS